MSPFCRDCASWQFEHNPQIQNSDEADGFGICERIAQMMTNPTRAIARMDDKFSRFQCRGEFGCNLFEAK